MWLLKVTWNMSGTSTFWRKAWYFYYRSSLSNPLCSCIVIVYYPQLWHSFLCFIIKWDFWDTLVIISFHSMLPATMDEWENRKLISYHVKGHPRLPMNSKYILCFWQHAPNLPVSLGSCRFQKQLFLFIFSTKTDFHSQFGLLSPEENTNTHKI